jgi:hypothetical protein
VLANRLGADHNVADLISVDFPLCLKNLRGKEIKEHRNLHQRKNVPDFLGGHIRINRLEPFNLLLQNPQGCTS